MDGEELTEQETALYDRQIRVWGADAQRRLLNLPALVLPARVLFALVWLCCSWTSSKTNVYATVIMITMHEF